MSKAIKTKLQAHKVCSGSCKSTLSPGWTVWWQDGSYFCLRCGPNQVSQPETPKPDFTPSSDSNSDVLGMLGDLTTNFLGLQSDLSAVTTSTRRDISHLQSLTDGLSQGLAGLIQSVGEIKRSEPQRFEIKVGGTEKKAEIRNPHKLLKSCLSLLQTGFWKMLLVGPAGSGKTTLAKHLAQSLGLEFGFMSMSMGVTETSLYAKTVPNSEGGFRLTETQLIKRWRDGGVFLLDEIDAGDSNVLVSFNAALANGILSNPVTGEIIPRHESCFIIAAANTYGNGATAQYQGRNALDGATLDRFVGAILTIDYDEDLERSLCSESQVIIRNVQIMRQKARDAGLRRIIGTRMVEAGIMHFKFGLGWADIFPRLTEGWSQEEKEKVKV